MSTHEPTLGRRSLLKLGAALLATPAAAGAGVPASRSTSSSRPARGTRVFRAQLVLEGADCRLAFVCDHHWWPNHKENWGGGAQITSLSDRKMPDLAEVLNEEAPDVSIHAGDVISAAGSFFPPPAEYAQQLAFAKAFYGKLTHPAIPMVGNHETLDAHYASHEQLRDWQQHFGAPFREHDCGSWRLLTLNPMLPNPGRALGPGDSYGNYYGLDDEQLAWLKARLADAAASSLKALVAVHVPPVNWLDAAAFERVLVEAGCVKAVLAGHWHRNNLSFLGGIPVLVRASNVEAPFAYSMVYGYPDGRLIVVQKSQHFPLEDFISTGFAQGKQGSVADRYLTLGGSSQLPLQNLRLAGEGAHAVIADGHLRVSNRDGRASVLIDTAPLRDARLTLTIVKAGGERVGGVALAAADGSAGIDATITSRYSPDGKVMIGSSGTGGREVLARSWFNIADDIAYRLTLEVRDGRVRASWKNMVDLEADVRSHGPGLFGAFVERGTMLVTDLAPDRLDT